MHLSKLGIQLKARRKSLRLTQSDLSSMAEVALRTIKSIEAGTGNPSALTLIKLLDVLGLELSLGAKKMNNNSEHNRT